MVAAVAFGVLTGCESGGGGDGEKSSSPGNSVVGTWSLSNAEGLWFIFFKPDNTWTICDNADGSQRRVYGTYTVSGKTVRGPMTNPGVGTGEIVATVDDNNIALAFIEHWHSPYKVVNYTGNRL